MSTTIAVAIITALATIAGGSTAAVISLMAQSRQTVLQQESQRRQARRDAYVELLTKFDEITSILDNIWLRPPPSNNSVDVIRALDEPVNCYAVLRIASNTVLLEGPRNVNDVTWGLTNLFMEEMIMVDKSAKEHPGTSEKLSSYTDRDAILAKRLNAKNRFIDEAAKALGLNSKLQLDSSPGHPGHASRVPERDGNHEYRAIARRQPNRL